MTKTRTGVLTLLVGIGVTIAFLYSGKGVNHLLNAAATVQNPRELRLDIPDARWESSFFETLEERTKKVNLASLRAVVLPDHDLEVRFWYDHFETISGLIIRRSSEKWSAAYLHQVHDNQPSSVKLESIGAPKSGWDAIWTRLSSAGILTLPDASKTKCKSDALDGLGYVVESNLDREYRVYRYGNPQLAECDEAKRVVLIEEIIADAFGLHRFQH